MKNLILKYDVIHDAFKVISYKKTQTPTQFRWYWLIRRYHPPLYIIWVPNFGNALKNVKEKKSFFFRVPICWLIDIKTNIYNNWQLIAPEITALSQRRWLIMVSKIKIKRERAFHNLQEEAQKFFGKKFGDIRHFWHFRTKIENA